MVLYLNGSSDGTHTNTAAHTGVSKTYWVEGHTDITVRVDAPANWAVELTTANVTSLYDAR